MTELGIGLALFAALVVVGAGLRAWGWLARRRAMSLLPAGSNVVPGISTRVMARGRHGMAGIAAGRTHRTTTHLGYTDDRLVIASNRGILVDLRVDGGRFLTSVRTPGPGKLVIEGETPGPGGPIGTFRLELWVASPATLVAELQRFARAPEDRPTFGSLPDPSATP